MNLLAEIAIVTTYIRRDLTIKRKNIHKTNNVEEGDRK